jgi:DNA invertase Pin-like site-specific DNA recombinase
MSESAKVSAAHLHRRACVYVRQSTGAQVEHNRESTDRQYRLVERAVSLGWRNDQVTVIDEDLGVSGGGLVERTGFARLTSDVALGHVGIVLGLEVSRLARNNADWYRLLDLCGVTDTLIGDADGIYHPGLFNDRLVLGLKGTMSEAELHVLRARLAGGIRNKAERGELRRGLPIGFVWGDADGEVRMHDDEAIIGVLRAVFDRFAEMGSVRQVWLWLRAQDLKWPLQASTLREITWVVPTYTKIHQVLTNPVYAGAYVYGKSRHERYVDELGRVRKRARRLPRAEWSIVIRDHHPGFIDWATFEANQVRIGANTHPRRHETEGAVREGAALLQGIATCGRCGRGLRVYYSGRNATPGYHCAGATIVNGRGEYCMRVGGLRIDEAVSDALITAITPAGLEASLRAVELSQTENDAALAQWRRQVEHARYEAQRAERRYRAVDPDNRLVARGLEAEWEARLRELGEAELAIAQREKQQPRTISDHERVAIRALGDDLRKVWSASTTTARERKELLRASLEEVIVTVDRVKQQAHLALRWRGGVIHERDIDLRRVVQAANRTAEETVDLVRRLAVHYPDDIIAGILNRQGRATATGLRFTANRVCSLRTHWGIPRCERANSDQGELVTVQKAAEILGVAASTVHRWINDGFIAAEQITPGAPWQIRVTDDLRARFVEEAPVGYVPMVDAMRILGVSRQTVLQRVKRGDLHAVHVRSGRRKGLRIRVPESLPSLFDANINTRGAM